MNPLTIVSRQPIPDRQMIEGFQDLVSSIARGYENAMGQISSEIQQMRVESRERERSLQTQITQFSQNCTYLSQRVEQLVAVNQNLEQSRAAAVAATETNRLAFQERLDLEVQARAEVQQSLDQNQQALQILREERDGLRANFQSEHQLRAEVEQQRDRALESSALAVAAVHSNAQLVFSARQAQTNAERAAEDAIQARHTAENNATLQQQLRHDEEMWGNLKAEYCALMTQFKNRLSATLSLSFLFSTDYRTESKRGGREESQRMNEIYAQLQTLAERLGKREELALLKPPSSRVEINPLQGFMCTAVGIPRSS